MAEELVWCISEVYGKNIAYGLPRAETEVGLRINVCSPVVIIFGDSDNSIKSSYYTKHSLQDNAAVSPALK